MYVFMHFCIKSVYGFEEEVGFVCCHQLCLFFRNRLLTLEGLRIVILLQYSGATMAGGCATTGTRVPTAASPANTASSSSSNTGSAGGTRSTSLSTAPPPPASSTSTGIGGEQLSRTNLYIRGLNQNTSDKDLVQMCQMYVIKLLLRINVFR